MQSKFVQTNSTRLHYLEFSGEQPTLVLLHGVTANAHAFDGLIAAGLSPAFNIISVDLRGREQSSQPASGYTVQEHAKDIIGLPDELKIEKAYLCDHSFGALITLYIASHFPNRVQKMILMDAGIRLHEKAKEMLGPALSRLGQTYPSFENYIEKVKSAPYLNF